MTFIITSRLWSVLVQVEVVQSFHLGKLSLVFLLSSYRVDQSIKTHISLISLSWLRCRHLALQHAPSQSIYQSQTQLRPASIPLSRLRPTVCPFLLIPRLRMEMLISASV
jgi:hypothetical protein